MHLPPPTLMPALVTPFDREGEIDLAAHRHNVTKLTDEGLEGFVIGGSTGQGPYLEPGERRRLLQTAREAAPEAALVCGINAETVRVASQQIDEAAQGGADAVLVLTPTTLVRNRHEAVERFYHDVAEAADAAGLPLFLYTVPRVTGYELPLDAIIRLSAHPGIVGMKDSGGNPERVARLQGNTSEPFHIFIGASRAVAAGVAAGAHGAITASANYARPILHDLLRAASRAARDTGRLQGTLDTLTKEIEPFGIPGTMTAAGIVGLRPGTPRRPLRVLDPPQRSTIRAALRDAGLPTGTVA